MVSHMGYVNFEKSRSYDTIKKLNLAQILHFSIQFERNVNLASVFRPAQSATWNFPYQN